MNGRDEATAIRSEEELTVDRVREAAGAVGVRKHVETFTVEDDVPRQREDFGDVDRIEIQDDDGLLVDATQQAPDRMDRMEGTIDG